MERVQSDVEQKTNKGRCREEEKMKILKIPKLYMYPLEP